MNAVQQNSQESTVNNMQESLVSPKKSSKLFLVIVIVFITFIILVIVFALLNNQKLDNSQSTDTSNVDQNYEPSELEFTEESSDDTVDKIIEDTDKAILTTIDENNFTEPDL